MTSYECEKAAKNAVIKVAKVQGYIDADGLQLLKKFKENQETWQD